MSLYRAESICQIVRTESPLDRDGFAGRLKDFTVTVVNSGTETRDLLGRDWFWVQYQDYSGYVVCSPSEEVKVRRDENQNIGV